MEEPEKLRRASAELSTRPRPSHLIAASLRNSHSNMSGKDGAAAPKLSFGFKKAVPAIGAGFAAKPSSSSKASSSSAPTRRAAFGDDEASDEDGAVPIAASSKFKATAITTKKPSQPIGLGAGGKAPPSKAAAARQAEALQLDSSVFDYDGVYDAMKSGDAAAKKKREEEAKKRDVSTCCFSLPGTELGEREGLRVDRAGKHEWTYVCAVRWRLPCNL